jgi:hypothetical protein
LSASIPRLLRTITINQSHSNCRTFSILIAISTAPLNHATVPIPFSLAKLIDVLPNLAYNICACSSTLLPVSAIGVRLLHRRNTLLSLHRHNLRSLPLSPLHPLHLQIHHHPSANQNSDCACENRLPVNHNLDGASVLLIHFRSLPRHCCRACHIPPSVKYHLFASCLLSNSILQTPKCKTSTTNPLHQSTWLTKSQSQSVVTAVVVNLPLLYVS